ncbi:hypothetical protein BHM03_00030341 [Ensete ventricosum]|nr:hypothetical protein BHM03_00030341 [Ensete ventricosum]
MADYLQDAGELIGQLPRDNTALRAQVGRPEEEKKAIEAQATELSSQLAQACLRVQELKQCLAEVCREADLGFNKMDLELNLALCCVEEAEVWVEEARDEAAITKDMSHRVQWRASERLRRTDSCAPYRSRG